jgi:hypothetical protein
MFRASDWPAIGQWQRAGDPWPQQHASVSCSWFRGYLRRYELRVNARCSIRLIAVRRIRRSFLAGQPPIDGLEHQLGEIAYRDGCAAVGTGYLHSCAQLEHTLCDRQAALGALEQYFVAVVDGCHSGKATRDDIVEHACDEVSGGLLLREQSGASLPCLRPGSPPRPLQSRVSLMRSTSSATRESSSRNR